jgi:hypothetical protein
VEAAGNKRCFHNNGINGAKGERYIRSLYPNSSTKPVYKGYVDENNILQKRFIDVLTEDGVAIEVKTGYTKLTPRIRNQIVKDIELRKRYPNEIKEIRWEFVKSPATGMMSPSDELRAFLEDNGIAIREYNIDI